MYRVSAQGVDERMINVQYYYYVCSVRLCNNNGGDEHDGNGGADYDDRVGVGLYILSKVQAHQ